MTTDTVATDSVTSEHPFGNEPSPMTVNIRMYRPGLGDCFLVTLQSENVRPFYLMIDFGVILGTEDAATKMQAVLSHIIKTTKGRIDRLLVTHEHWDHVSGFVQARELFDQLQIDEVWLGWTENPNDALAQKLQTEHQALKLALGSASTRMRLDGNGDSLIDGILEFFGARGQGTTAEALEFARKLGKNNKEPRYCYPSQAPIELTGTGVRAYILGPPHDEKALKRSDPSRNQPETYGFADAFLSQLAPAFTGDESNAPFDPIRQIPLSISRQMPFFQKHYWEVSADSPTEKDQSWRRIDTDWLKPASDLALQLDNATNNTSLVVALELPNSEVLLFAADAQVGNWLSWQDLAWDVAGRKVTGPDLLRRTVFYKVGHHGSHNATLRDNGLELMTNLKIACIPVDHDMAIQKGWGKMPLEELEARLNEITKGRVLRVDKPIPPALSDCVQPDPKQILYYEIEMERCMLSFT